jgi:formylglycine-generating enzyme
VCALLLGVSRCQLVGGMRDVYFEADASALDGGSSGSDGGVLADGALADGAKVDGGPCGFKPDGPTMALITAPSAKYCIDTTEVTNAQYEKFLDYLLPGGRLDVPSHCTKYVALDATYTPKRELDLVNKGNLPRANVLWCHAWAYCKWAGKRLCGRIGGGESVPREGGGHTPRIDNEWDFACINGTEKYDFAYDAVGSPTMCNLGPTDVNVRSMPGCHGKKAPFDTLFDMSGNAPEYVNLVEDLAAVPPDTPSTRLTGGRYPDSPNDGACGNSRSVHLDYAVIGGAIRCCADVP